MAEYDPGKDWDFIADISRDMAEQEDGRHWKKKPLPERDARIIEVLNSVRRGGRTPHSALTIIKRLYND